MKTDRLRFGFLLFLAMGVLAASAAEKIRVLVVVGGHDFETNQFYRMFQDNPEITFERAEHPHAHIRFNALAASRYDVLVFYDMWQKISNEARADLVNCIKEGKGLVALHHCLASYQDWDEYRKLIGGRYHLQKRVEEGVEKPASTYKHDVKFGVRVADRQHPITRGVDDFEIHDETYGRFEVLPNVHALLTTDEPTSSRTVGWCHAYGKGRVVYLQLGHDHFAYENPNYRRLLAQSIRWVAPRQRAED